jgi:hypothetical protein
MEGPDCGDHLIHKNSGIRTWLFSLIKQITDNGSHVLMRNPFKAPVEHMSEYRPLTGSGPIATVYGIFTKTIFDFSNPPPLVSTRQNSPFL